MQESGDFFFGKLECYARAGAAGEGEDFFPDEEVAWVSVFSSVTSGSGPRREERVAISLGSAMEEAPLQQRGSGVR